MKTLLGALLFTFAVLGTAQTKTCEEYAAAWPDGSRQSHLRACREGLEGPGRTAEAIQKEAERAAEKARQQRWADMTDEERAASVARDREQAAAKARVSAVSKRREADRKASAAAKAECMAKLPHLPNAPIGFTAEQVRCQFGKPRNINTTVNPAGRHEQWVYSGVYVYLVNGVVTSYQTQQ